MTATTATTNNKKSNSIALRAALLARFLMSFLEYLEYSGYIYKSREIYLYVGIHTREGDRVKEKQRRDRKKERERKNRDGMTFLCGERGKPLKFLTAAAAAAAAAAAVVVVAACLMIRS